VAEVDLAEKLSERLRQAVPDLEKLNRYYEGAQPLSYMHPELLRELQGRVRQLVINWPRLVVDSLEERLDVEGFRLGDDVDERMWQWWQANSLDLASQQAHVEALAMRRSFAIVGSNPDDPGTPLVTVESPLQVIARRDPATRRVEAAAKVWSDDDDVEHVTLYLPDVTIWFQTVVESGRLAEVDRDEHRLGRVPVVPIVNRGRILQADGVSELTDVIPISDAACKIATDMMIGADFNAIPRTIAMGMTEQDFTDRDGNPVSKWEKIAGRIWAVTSPPGEAEVKQLAAADLRNFHDTINTLARLVASIAGLPPHYFGWSDANPASADAIRSAETRLVKRAERRQRGFGEAWEEVMRLCFLVTDGELPANAARMETVWRDPATPTTAAAADALAKLKDSLEIPAQALWEKVPGVTQEEVRRWKAAAEAERNAEARAQATAFGVIPTEVERDPAAEQR